MSLPSFLKEKQNKESADRDAPKKDFRQKCLSLLSQIKELGGERHSQLMGIFRSRYDKENISKKKISGFYAQLVNELKQLKETSGMEVRKTTKRVFAPKAFLERPSPPPKREKASPVEKVANAKKKKISKKKKKVAKKAVKKKTVKKKTAKKKTAKKKKAAPKKTAKKKKAAKKKKS